jgi:hypothetical protein
LPQLLGGKNGYVAFAMNIISRWFEHFRVGGYRHLHDFFLKIRKKTSHSASCGCSWSHRLEENNCINSALKFNAASAHIWPDF